MLESWLGGLGVAGGGGGGGGGGGHGACVSGLRMELKMSLIFFGFVENEKEMGIGV